VRPGGTVNPRPIGSQPPAARQDPNAPPQPSRGALNPIGAAYATERN
jgi:hypothetical protein